MAETDPKGLADRLEHQADDLERHNRELEERAEDVSQEWQRKRSDPGVPGAPPEGEGEDEATEGEGEDEATEREGEDEAPEADGEDEAPEGEGEDEESTPRGSPTGEGDDD